MAGPSCTIWSPRAAETFPANSDDGAGKVWVWAGRRERKPLSALQPVPPSAVGSHVGKWLNNKVWRWSPGEDTSSYLTLISRVRQ